MAVFTFTKDSTPRMPTADPDRAGRVERDGERFAADLRSGAAWEQFCDALRDAGRAILRSEDAASDTDWAEGYHYLLGLLESQLTAELYRTDGDFPAFTKAASDVVKVGMDNPDATLLSAPLTDGGTFRIYGTVHEIRMVEFIVAGSGGHAMHFLEDMTVGSDGAFSVTISPEPQPGNWIELPPGAHSVLVRRASYDWDHEEVPRLAIERVGADPATVPFCLRTPTAARVGEQLDTLGSLIRGNADYWVDMVHSFRDEGDNVIPAPRPLPATGMNPTRSSVKGFFNLAPDEALIVEFDPPAGVFWSVSIGDMWYRTFNYTHHQNSLNGHQIEVDEYGHCVVVIAHEDPAVANWLDTVHHERGVICFRWVRVDSRPQPSTRLVKFADLSEVLPPSLRRVTTQERTDTLARRRAAIARRFAGPITTRWSYSTAVMEPDPNA